MHDRAPARSLSTQTLAPGGTLKSQHADTANTQPEQNDSPSQNSPSSTTPLPQPAVGVASGVSAGVCVGSTLLELSGPQPSARAATTSSASAAPRAPRCARSRPGSAIRLLAASPTRP